MDYKNMLNQHEDKEVKSVYQVCHELTNGYTVNTDKKQIDFSIVLVQLQVK